MLEFGKGRVDLLVFVKGVFSTVVDDLIADGVFAYFALHGFIAVVEAVGSLEADSFAPEPAFEALEVDELDGSAAEADIEERIRGAIFGVEANPATFLVLRIYADSTPTHKHL